MDRRSLFGRLLAAASGTASVVLAARTAQAAPQPALKVVYHIADFEKVSFALGNIRNHIDGAGGPDAISIAVVVHGAALRAFHLAGANMEVSARVGEYTTSGVAFHACIHTMKGQNVSLAQLMPGFEVADRGGVTRITELQSKGYLYIRP